MILSYAVTTTAITFRLIKNLFYDEKYHDYELFYGTNVWLALVINLLIAYLILRKNSAPIAQKRFIIKIQRVTLAISKNEPMNINVLKRILYRLSFVHRLKKFITR
ncbi:hypothetical protein EJ377_19935 [Chryseobacterium arthrosphaerae]|uniref:Uncharacterized protein n=1 Tax=Chryseobacterium arthrosphaerae TaxID=651561 RepID=A0A432DTR4_9FLAO|nr:hypothetical protein EJ377_19935 [Chryseobacterium arthrosphaerae]